MKVKLLCGRSGVDFSQNAGEVIDVDGDEGGRMVAAGQAEPYSETASDQLNLLDKPTNTEELVQVARQPSLVEKAVKKLFGEKAAADE